jgi:hypothetical protein
MLKTFPSISFFCSPKPSPLEEGCSRTVELGDEVCKMQHPDQCEVAGGLVQQLLLLLDGYVIVVSNCNAAHEQACREG